MTKIIFKLLVTLEYFCCKINYILCISTSSQKCSFNQIVNYFQHRVGKKKVTILNFQHQLILEQQYKLFSNLFNGFGTEVHQSIILFIFVMTQWGIKIQYLCMMEQSHMSNISNSALKVNSEMQSSITFHGG